MLSFRSILAASILVAAFTQNDDMIRINQIQVIGTHNSYHSGFAPSAAKLWQQKNPKVFAGLDYRHPSLTSQLDGGVRQIELDIFADTKGGLYAHPFGETLIAQAGLPADPPFDPQHLMEKPGFKVMHVQDVDYRSTCEPFTACLAEVRAWSKAHPDHLPVFILVETKQGRLQVDFPTVTPETFTPAVFDDLDHEIASVFSPAEMITPDNVRGRYATLNEAVRADQWPTLKQARGKVIFLMDQKKMGPIYLQGHPSLKGRILFTNADAGTADAAFIEQNDAPAEAINALVRQGYLIRTRADSDTKEARTNNTARRDAVLASGAQIISTDYPAAEQAPSGYKVELPGNAVARCNPCCGPRGVWMTGWPPGDDLTDDGLLRQENPEISEATPGFDCCRCIRLCDIPQRMDNQPQIASLASIHRYPVKSMAGEAVTNTELTQFGLRFDRLYAFESSGAPAGMLRLTSRQRQRMLHYQPTLQEDGQTTVRLPTGKQMLVSAPALLDDLRSQDSESSKFVLTEASTPQTDVRPLSLISLQTITRLSAEIGHLLDPRRFRANLYLDIPAGPFAEDRLAGRALRIGTSATILIRERDPRCRFITYDPDDPEATPLFSLMKLLDREHEGRAGVYATVQIPGPIATGDPVYLVKD